MHSICGCPSNAAWSPIKLCLQHCTAVFFPFIFWFRILATFFTTMDTCRITGMRTLKKKKKRELVLKQANSHCPLGLAAFLFLWQHYCFQTLQVWWDQIMSSLPGASDKSNLLISQVRGEWPDTGRLQPLVSRAAASVFASLTLMSLMVSPLKRRHQS